MRKWMTAAALLSCLSIAPQAWADSSPSLSPASSAQPSAAAAVPSPKNNANVASYKPTSLIKTDGSLWVWGDDVHSVPTRLYGLTDVAVSFPLQYVMKKDGTVEHYTADARNPSIVTAVPVPALNNLLDVAYGEQYQIALNTDGKLFRIDAPNAVPDLKTVSLLEGIDNVSAISGYYEIDAKYDYKWIWLFLKKDGTVWTADKSLRSFAPIHSLTQIVTLSSAAALKDDGTVWMLPAEVTAHSEPLTAAPIEGMADIRRIGGGGTYWAIDKNGCLWLWGITVTGISDGTTYHNNTQPVLLSTIGDVQDAAVIDRSLLALSKGSLYETSIETESMPANPAFRQIATSIRSMQPGGRHAIMQQNDGTLLGFGFGKHGELGNASYEIWQFDHTVHVARAVDVFLNGELLPLSNGLIIRGGQSFVPLRSVFEKLGASLDFDLYTKIVTIKRTGDANLTLSIDTKNGTALLNGKPVEMPGSPFILAGSVYLPLRFVSETLGAKVEWSAKEDRVAITMN